MSRYLYIHADLSSGRLRMVLDRPPLNILSVEMMGEINDCLAGVKMDPDIKAVVISAEGRAFSAGVAIEDHSGERLEPMLSEFHRIFRQLHSLPCATLAAVHGAALGGGAELATFCDVVIAAENAKIGQPEIKVGVFPPIAALHYPSRIGQARALQLLLSGDAVEASEAERIGLVDRVVPGNRLEGAIEEAARKFTDKSRAVLALARRAVLGSPEQFETRLAELELLYRQQLTRCEDANEGLRAFVEKRQPVWSNR